MKKDYLLSASILSADFTNLSEAISAAEDAGVDWIHVDVMDGHFVPNLTMGPFIVEALRRITDLPLDVHLMIESPAAMLEAFRDAGADSLTVHVEADPHLNRTLQRIRELGLRSGVALNPGTPALSIEEVIDLTDLILVMTVNPGYSGQAFIPSTIDKIERIREILDERGLPTRLQVDGGISASTAPLAARAGADVFVSASAIFKHPEGVQAGVQALMNALDSAALQETR